MDSIVYSIIAFLIGCGCVLLVMLKHILHSYSISAQFMSVELDKTKSLLEKKCEEFDAITKKASDANHSLAARIPDIDNKLADMQNKLQMMSLRFQGK